MKKSGELVDRSAADRQFFSLVRKFLNFQNLSGLVAARLISSDCHDILAEEGAAIPR